MFKSIFFYVTLSLLKFTDLIPKIAKTNGAMKEYLESLKKVFKIIIKGIIIQNRTYHH